MRVSGRRRWCSSAWLLVLLASSGCGSAPVLQPAVVESASPVLAELLEPLQRSLDSRDRPAFLANFAPGEATRQGSQLFGNLRQFQAVRFRPAVQPNTLEVQWRVPGDAVATAQLIVLTFERSESGLVIGSLRPESRASVWLLGGTAVRTSARGTVIAPDTLVNARLTDWGRRLDRAATAVERSDLGSLDDGWNERLVVELPATAADYRALSSGTGVGAAAVTVCDNGSPRIVVNPTQLDEDRGYLDALLIHEAVHVATNAPCDPAGPQWVREGLAEWVAAEHSPSTRAYDREWVVWHLSRHQVPRSLPSDADFTGADDDEVLSAYALSALAVDVAVRRLGRTGAMTFLDGLSLPVPPEAGAVDDLTGWYRAELGRIAASG